MIVFDSVSKRFGRVLALDRVNLEIEQSETVAIFGPNGAGKTTLLRIAAGLLRPTEGEISVGGKSPLESRASIGYLGTDPLLYPNLTAIENLGIFAELYDAPFGEAVRLIGEVGLDHKKSSLVRTLSQGETQRVAIARSLLHNPDYLIVDEPFAGLDDESAAAFGPLIAREGRTTIIATHDIDRGKAIADRVVSMTRGRTT